MADKRIIKKYPNRRLYDTAESKYITLEDVRNLVLKGIPFCVLDKKTDDDITRNILLQIIIEQEEEGEPIFTTDVLTRLIGFYGDSVQNMASGFLERSIGLFTEQQHAFQQQMEEAVKGTPLAAMTEVTQRNWNLWQKMQEDLFRAATSATQSPSKADTKPAGDEN